jgi:hypothetical protein
VDGKILVKPCDIAEGWATYFERLSKSLLGPPNVKCSAINDCSSGDLPDFCCPVIAAKISIVVNSPGWLSVEQYSRI